MVIAIVICTTNRVARVCWSVCVASSLRVVSALAVLHRIPWNPQVIQIVPPRPEVKRMLQIRHTRRLWTARQLLPLLLRSMLEPVLRTLLPNHHRPVPASFR